MSFFAPGKNLKALGNRLGFLFQNVSVSLVDKVGAGQKEREMGEEINIPTENGSVREEG